MPSVIRYRVRRAYGREFRDILDARYEAAYWLLTGAKTLTDDAMTALREFGVQFEEVE